MSSLVECQPTQPERLEAIYQSYFTPPDYDPPIALNLVTKALGLFSAVEDEGACRRAAALAATARPEGNAYKLLTEVCRLAWQCGFRDELVEYREMAVLAKHRDFIDNVNRGSRSGDTVVFVAKTPYFVLLRVAMYLRRKGHRAFLVTLNPIPAELETLFVDAMDGIACSDGSHMDLRLILAKVRPSIVHIQMWMLSYELCRLAIEANERAPVVCEFYDVTSIYATRGELTRVWPAEVVDFDLAMERYVMENAAGILSRYPKWAMEKWARALGAPDQLVACNHAYPLPEYRQSKVRSPGAETKRRRLVYAGGLIPTWLDPELFPEAYMPLAFKKLLEQGFEIDVLHDPHRPIDENPVYAPFRHLERTYPGFRLINGAAPQNLPGLLREYDFGILLTRFPARVSINPDQKAGVVATKIYAYLEAGIPILVNAEYLEMARIAIEHGVGLAVHSKCLDNLTTMVDTFDYERALAKVDAFNTVFGMDKQIDGIVDFYQKAKARVAESTSTKTPHRSTAIDATRSALQGKLTELFVALAEENGQAERVEQALACYRQAKALAPASDEVVAKFGGVLEAQGRLDEAVAEYRHCLSLNPLRHDVYHRLMVAQNVLGSSTAEAVRRDARRFGSAVRRLQIPVTPSRLRVGFFVGAEEERNRDLILAPFFQHHSEDRFEVHAFLHGPPNFRRATRMPGKPVAWHRIHGGPEEWLRAVRWQGIDIAVDVSGLGEIALLEAFASGLAPRQMSWSLNPISSGIKEIGFVLSDWATVPSGEDRMFTETVLRHPTRAWALPPPFNERGRELPEGGDGRFCFVYAGPAHRLTAEVMTSWSRILARCPDTILRIYADGLTRAQAAEFKSGFGRGGIDAARVLLQKGGQSLRRPATWDLMLDPFPVGNGVEVARYLAEGTPAVCLAVGSRPNRIVGSMLSSIGMSTLAAVTLEGYEDAAVEFAKTHRDQGSRRQDVLWRVRGSDLYDGRAMVREVENLLLMVA